LSATRPAFAEIDLDAIAGNARLLARLVAPARLCAVVKADAYGHGAVPVARALTKSGVPMLAVALVAEGIELRNAGIDVPVLVLSECAPDETDEAVGAGLGLTVYSAGAVREAEAAARRLGRRARVHLKVDTGMHRVGADLEDLGTIAQLIDGSDALELEGLFTHLAVADDPEDPFTDVQLERFARARAELSAMGIVPHYVHVANSAAAISRADSRLDIVRCGIAIYGHLPSEAISPSLDDATGDRLKPAMSIHAKVSFIRRLRRGERLSYGRQIPLPDDAFVATVPIGYADGLPRALGAKGGAVLIGGVRRPIAGTVTMDQIMVNCGGSGDVAPGDPVVLLGRQGDETITSEEWAERTGTIAYEVLCRIGPRLPRTYRGEVADRLSTPPSQPGFVVTAPGAVAAPSGQAVVRPR
jgi:alanine racemase